MTKPLYTQIYFKFVIFRIQAWGLEVMWDFLLYKAS